MGNSEPLSEPLIANNLPERDGKLSMSEPLSESVRADDHSLILVPQPQFSEPPSELLLNSLKEDNKTPLASITRQDELPSEPLIISDESSKEEASLVENECLDSRTPVELLSSEAKEDSKKQSASIPPPSELPSERLRSNNNDENSNEEASSVANNELPSDLPRSTLGSSTCQIPNNLTGAALARRLNVSPASISRNKNKENFGQWASQHDPNGVTWDFDGEKFITVIPLDVEEKPL